MPHRLLAANKLAEFLSAISHSLRIQIVEELRKGEMDVGSLQESLGVPHSNVSQHLGIPALVPATNNQKPLDWVDDDGPMPT